MYEKKLIGHRPLYFRYAPPLTGLDDYSDDELPKMPFKGAKPFQRSVYYFWWLFLKAHSGYRECCESGGVGDYSKLYHDFGDVRDDDFMSWWKKIGRYLFCEPQEEQIYVHPSPEFRLDDDSRIVVSIPISRDVNKVAAELKQLLKPLRQVAGRDAVGKAHYEVSAKPVLSSLHQHHQMWSLRKQYPGKPLHMLAEMAGVTIDDRSDRGVDAKQVKAIVASRYLKQAECLIEFVSKGCFPITTKAQARLLGLV